MTHDDEQDDDFTRRLREGLTRAAALAPAGPAGDRVLMALSRRQRSRRFIALLSTAAAMLLCVGLIVLNRHDDTASVVDPVAVQQPDADAHRASNTLTAHDPTHDQSPSRTPHLRNDAGWGRPLLSMSAPVDADADDEAREPSWNLSLSLTLASPSDTADWRPVMELSSPQW